MEENSGVKFQQAMVALARQWVGQEVDGDKSQPTTVSIVVPVENENTTAVVEGTKNEVKTETFPLPQDVEEAKGLIDRFQRGAETLRSDEDVSDNVVKYLHIERCRYLAAEIDIVGHLMHLELARTLVGRRGR